MCETNGANCHSDFQVELWEQLWNPHKLQQPPRHMESSKITGSRLFAVWNLIKWTEASTETKNWPLNEVTSKLLVLSAALSQRLNSHKDQTQEEKWRATQTTAPPSLLSVHLPLLCLALCSSTLGAGVCACPRCIKDLITSLSDR